MRSADPLLQQLEHPVEADVSVNDTLRPVSRYFDRITRPEMLIPAVLNAMRVLADPADTGAVTLALPQDVQAEAYDWPEEFFAERVWHVRRPVADPYELAEAVRAIRAAERPLIVAGGGVHHSEAEGALKALVDATGIPVASTQAGKGSLRHYHPADLGGIGHTGTAVSDDIARTADLIIGLGTRYTDFTTASNTLFQQPGVRFVNLNITAFDAHKLAARPLVADARTGLEGLTEGLSGHRVDAAYAAEYRAGKARWEEVVQAAYRAEDSAVPTQTQVLGAWTPSSATTTWSSTRPARSPVTCTSCGARPAPVPPGVRLLLHGLRDPGLHRRPAGGPRHCCWSLVGDGTYLMMPTEIVTAVQEGLPVNLVLIQNHGYASIGGLSEEVGGERFGTAYRYRAADGTFSGAPLPVDLAANAASLGMDVIRPKTVRELRDALAAARVGPADLRVRRDRPNAHRSARRGLVGRTRRRSRLPRRRVECP